MRRALKIFAWVFSSIVILAVLAVSSIFIAANTQAGRAWIEHLTWQLTSGTVKLVGLNGTFPSHLTLEQLQLIDTQGVWLSAEKISVDWSIWELLGSRIRVDDLKAEHVAMLRTPVSSTPPSKKQPSIPHIDIARFDVARIDLGADLVGTPASLEAHGSIELRSLQNALADVTARRIDNDGEYQVRVRFNPRRMDANVKLKEPAGGPLEHLAGLPGLGALDATLNVSGLRTAEHIDLSVDAGELHARVQGKVNVEKPEGDIQFSLTSPALSPRPDISWQRVALEGHVQGTLQTPVAQGQLTLERLRVGAAWELAKLSADLSSEGAKLSIKSVIDGLRIPGPSRDLLSKDPLKITGSVRFDDAKRPVELDATHPLFNLRAQGNTAPQIDAQIGMKIPEIVSLAALGAQDVHGQASLKSHVDIGAELTTVSLDAEFAFTGGGASWLKFVGKRATLQFAGDFDDSHYRVSNLRVGAEPLSFAANGKATRAAQDVLRKDALTGLAAIVADLQAQWDLNVTELGVLSPGIRGSLKASGRLDGTPSALTVAADVNTSLSLRGSPPGNLSASIRVRDIPTKPNGTIEAHGALDGAPLKVSIGVERGVANAVHGIIHAAAWKSLRAEGEVTAVDFAKPVGNLHIAMQDLGDAGHLLGTALSGALDASASFKPQAGQTEYQIVMRADKVAASGVVGNLQLSANGSLAALRVELGAQVPDLQGAALNLSAKSLLHLDAQQIEVTDLAVDYRGLNSKLLSIAQLSFSEGFAINQLNLAAGEAQLHLDGRLAPTLDLRASVEKVTPKLVNVFVPQLLAEGNIEARARLQGALSAPTGRVRVNASGLRFGNDAASDLAAIDIRARAELDGETAALDASLSAGGTSLLTATGPIPLNAGGAANLAIAGKLSVGIINPMLEARGMQAAGDISIDATVRGPLTDPAIEGAVALNNGSLRDYARGIGLTDINARLTGSQGTLQVESFQAKASSGTLGMTGSIGLLQPKMPVDLAVKAHNAQPIASSIVTANLDSDLTIKGTARERLDIVGTVHLNRTDIGIPNSFPPDVAVLDVRRRGVAPPTATAQALIIGLDVTIQAPQQILVQGRGLDAELGGEIHVGGTSDEPQVSGGFDLIRGSFTLVGSRLIFSNGRVGFEGVGLKKTIDPTLDFTATTALSDGTATLHISGFADSPKFDFSSSPVLEQDEILARLLFGENVSQLTALQAAQIGAALATLSGVGGGTSPLVKLQKSLGLDRLSVGSGTPSATSGGEPTGASIAAGRYVSKRIYVEGKQSTSGSSQVQVDVEITSHLKLQTKLGNGTAIQGTTPENDPGSSIGLSYQFEY